MAAFCLDETDQQGFHHQGGARFGVGQSYSTLAWVPEAEKVGRSP